MTLKGGLIGKLGKEFPTARKGVWFVWRAATTAKQTLQNKAVFIDCSRTLDVDNLSSNAC
jgi:hypothetical protein